MKKPKRVLFVYHNNFLFNTIGCNNYIFQIASYVKSQGCIVDLFSVTNVWNNFDTFEEFNAKYKLIDNLYLHTPDPASPYNDIRTVTEETRKTNYSLFGIPLWSKKKTERTVHAKANTPQLGWAYHDTVKRFEEVITANHYDIIDVHYLQMAEIVCYANIPEGTKVVYSSQDAYYMMNGFYQNGISGMAGIMPYELEIMSKFDAISCISFDELVFIRKLLPDKSFYHLPHPLAKRTLPEREKDIDILFLGFENPHNREGMKWFIDKVLPRIDKDVRITVCGLIWSSMVQKDPDHIRRAEEWGVQHIDFAEDLDELYARTKVSICPLLGGTGMKIKVIDSLARGIPVVTTIWGVDGFADKHNNGCLVYDDPESFAEAVNKLVKDDKLYNATKAAGDAYFEEFLSLEANRHTLDAVFELNAKSEGDNR